MRTLHTALAPTTTTRDVRLALSLFVHPDRWQRGDAGPAVQTELAQRLNVDTERMTLLDSGRNALRLILDALELKKTDAVFLQAFTCVSVPGPVLWAGGTPVYVDIIPDTFTMDARDLEKKLMAARQQGLRPRALIIQHTFGLPADMESILTVARTHGLAVIEDCAHALGATYRGRFVGTIGDAAIFSFGRDKGISSVFGGALLTHNEYLRARVEETRARRTYPPRAWIAQQLLHPPLATAARATYAWGGRYGLRVAQIFHLLSKALTAAEKRGGRPHLKPALFPNALAALALQQLRRLDGANARRQALARHYTESLRDVPGIVLPTVPDDRTHVFLRYTIRTKQARALRVAAKRERVILGTWYETPVDPAGTDLAAVGYVPGSCPQAEQTAREVANLPTAPIFGIPDADRVLRVVRATHYKMA